MSAATYWDRYSALAHNKPTYSLQCLHMSIKKEGKSHVKHWNDKFILFAVVVVLGINTTNAK